MIAKFIDNILFGMAFGLGWALVNALIAGLIHLLAAASR